MSTPNTIPAALTTRDQWVCWKYEGGTKVPYNARTGRKASSTDPSSWTTYAEACAAAPNYAGVGYVFAADDPFVGVDLDDCIDEHGQVASWAHDIVRNLNSYAEISPSQHGLKIWVEGKLPTSVGVTKFETGAIEMYDRGRYFTVTGKHLPSAPETITYANGNLDALYQQVQALKQTKTPPPVTLSQPTTNDAFIRDWVVNTIARSVARVTQAADGEKHTVRLKEARLLGGLIPHGLATADELEAALYHALPPKTAAQHAERQTIRDGLEYGRLTPLAMPEPPLQPLFDTQGMAYCPTHVHPLQPAKNGNGWRCSVYDCFWWKGDGYTSPVAATPTPATAQPSGSASTSKLLTLDELGKLPKPSWLIDGILRTNQLSLIFGRPGSGKSLLNLDIALSVAQFANVVYLASEDAEEYYARARAWCDHHQLPADRIRFFPEPVNLMNAASVTAFINEIAPLKPALVVVDTLSNCMVGGSQNDDRDMNLAVEGLNAIRRATQAAILTCHHPGWNEDHERGSTVLRGAARMVTKLQQNDDGLITLTCEKMNGAKPFDARYFRLRLITLAEGEECVTIIPASKTTNRESTLKQKHFDILEALDLPVFTGGASHGRLLDHLNCSKSTLNYDLSLLIDRGYIEADGDKRSKTYRLTVTGRRALQDQLFNSVQAGSTVVHTQFNTKVELLLNWPVVPPVDVQSSSGEDLNNIAHSDAVVHSAEALFNPSSETVQGPELFSSGSPPYKGEPLNSAELNVEQRDLPEPVIKIPVDHIAISTSKRQEGLDRGMTMAQATEYAKIPAPGVEVEIPPVQAGSTVDGIVDRLKARNAGTA